MELIGALFEAIFAALGMLLEGLVSLLSGAAEALSLGEMMSAAAAAIVELLVWSVLWLFALLTAIVRWRKPTPVPRPRIWRRREPSEAATAAGNTKDDAAPPS